MFGNETRKLSSINLYASYSDAKSVQFCTYMIPVSLY